MGERVEVGVLGPVAVRVDGREAVLSGVPQRVVLARLALAPGYTVSPGSLVDTLWPDGPPRNATGNLQAYVSRLRQVLGAGRIALEPGGYRLAGDVEVDTDRAEQLAAQARELPPDAAAKAFGTVLELWRGEPLADLPDHSRFEPDLARIAALRRRIRVEWLTARLAAGDAQWVLPDLEAAAAAEPLLEDVHVLLATALHRAGRTAEGLERLAAYRRRLADEHGLDPGPAVAETTARLLSAEPPGDGARRHAPENRFVGRDAELAAAEDALGGHRLVTLTGPGGVGKTRLSLELLDRIGAGTEVHLVELHLVGRAEDVPAAVATAVGLRAPAGPDALVGNIADRLTGRPALLVLDNCEHVRGPAHELTKTLLARCRSLRVLATSRQRLGLPGEKVLRLGPLADDDQVTLFCDRAALLRADFTPTPDVREICRSLDGLPLAVELAASREAVFGLRQLRERLAAGLDVLEPVRDGDRATAVTATVEWSYHLLDPAARTLFDRLSVCHGFPLDAAGHFVEHPEPLLADLVEASLVVALPQPDGTRRYRLLETMRRVGLGHLPDPDAARVMHASWMTAHAAHCYELQAGRSPLAAPALRADLANLREALAFLVDTGRWAQAGRIGLPTAYAMMNHPDLGLLAQLDRLAMVPDDVPAGDRARCLAAAGAATWLQGDGTRAEGLLAGALGGLPADEPLRWVAGYFLMVTHMFDGASEAVQRDVDALLTEPHLPEVAAANAVCCGALTHLYNGDPAAAQARLAAHAALVDRVGALDGFVAYTHGELAAATDPQTALEWFARATRRAEGHGHRYTQEIAAIGRAAVLIRLRRTDDAVLACRDTLESLRQTGMWPQLWVLLRLTAELLLDLGDAASAARLLASADVDPLAPAVLPPERLHQEELWSAIGEQAPRAPLPRTEAVALALDVLAAASAQSATGRRGAAGLPHDNS
ncbi:BTAD domain-containing putative transcriptional regulator [Dactylosporangium sp. NPDC005572]|uniref:BTAD domain-containing putative transcriptional regulator n=1 Tax=Dactylosporangium sp. NPDC005572 TaxID=3156889 RepID=UPI0033A8C3D8